MSSSIIDLPEPVTTPSSNPGRAATDAAYGYPRDFLTNQFVYLVVSPRAHGLSIGLNLNPDRECNFDCSYCEVDRQTPAPASALDVEKMAAELRATLDYIQSGKMAERPYFRNIPHELLTLRHITLSGDGEPTLCEQFREAVEAVVHIRAMGGYPFFKMVLVTNATGLDREPVIAGLKYFKSLDEIWCKLDGGSQAYLEKVNRSQVPLDHILHNILHLARQRPVVIQSLFPSINGSGPAWDEIESYSARLEQLRADGAKISLVQIYSATRPMHNDQCGHLPLRTLSKIAQHVRQRTGLRVEVF
jgi:wyosine [tRNA(Phe)-imidazoG37] synthetase (radical SAM superfamily)